MTDVLIVGGGIAGSALALLLGRVGLEVELYERCRFPREKACGEGLMPAGVEAMGRLGLNLDGAPFRGIRYHFAGETVAGEFPSPGGSRAAGLGVRRRLFDAALFEQAARHPKVRATSGAHAEGPVVENGRVAGVLVEGEVRRAELVVAADGLNSRMRHRLGLDVPVGRRRTGIRAHFRLAKGIAAPEWVNVHLGESHELYVTPLPRGEVAVALLADPAWLHGAAKGAFARAVRSQPRLANLLEGAEQVSELAGASPLASRARARVLPGFILFGDAAGYVDPITGGGMTQALLSAELFAAHLSRRFPVTLGDLECFDRERTRLLRSYHRLTRAVLWLFRHKRLARGALRVLRHHPAVFSRLVGVSGGVGLSPQDLGTAPGEQGTVLS